MKPIKLSHRLQMIADLVKPGSIVADIGTDHALLPAFLVQQKIIDRAYACDVAKGPLMRAEKLIQDYALMEQITPILCDGLSKVPNDVDTIIIAGMGYETIRMIIESERAKIKQCKHLLIQSNTELEALRRFIDESSYSIIRERIVHDGHYYTVIEVDPHHHRALSESEVLFGCGLENQADFHSYWQFRNQTLQTILEKMPNNHPQFEIYRQTKIRIENKLKKS